MNKIKLLILFLIFFGCTEEKQTPDYPIKSADIKNVILTDNFWLPKIKMIQETTIKFAFDKCEQEGRMENFLVAGGLKEGKFTGHFPFDDTDLYKIIEGASYSLISNPNEELETYLDSVISIIKIGQEPDGYISTWFTIDPLNPPSSWIKASGKRWLNPGGHELYNSGHLFEAATAHYLATGKKNFLNIAIKNADLLVDSFGPDKLQIPPGHQIVETGLIKLYNITKNKKYLELAKFFLDQKGNEKTHKLEGEYSQDHLPVVEQDEAVGHAVRAVYMYAGMTDIAAIYKDKKYLKAVNKIWDNVVNKKMYITGGLGARHEGESFGDNYELPNLTAYGETCAAIGNVYWNHRLFLLTGNSKYYDIIERTLYNGLISGISLGGTKFFYTNTLESDGDYKFNEGTCTRQAWFDCSCCPTNLIRFIPSIPGLVYATNEDSLFINLFISNHANLPIDGINTELIQQTNYPWDGKITIKVSPEKEQSFTIKLRIPSWAQGTPVPGDLYKYLNNNYETIHVKVNGEKQKIILHQGYLEITKSWQKGDSIEMILPMEVREVVTNEKVEENKNLVSIEYGPLVYCAEEIDNEKSINNVVIPKQAQFTIEKRENLLDGINIINCDIFNKEQQNLVLVPYYSWSNRGVGKMKVWIPREIE
ncbi:MAG: glycoside hydrolase family 127 protein [Ignavibacteriae bacterium]|nr:glycoside hydrolase family 127 protein [Ignavibacteriota bacterium]